MSEFKISAPLDAGFQPAVLGLWDYRKKVEASPEKEKVAIAVERSNGGISRWDMDIVPYVEGGSDETVLLVDRVIKFLIWARGGWKIYFSGPEALGALVRENYSIGGTREFDAELMGRVYERPFEVALVGRDEVPAQKESFASAGGHLDGCRIGFDLGASDYKLAAVQDGEPVFSTEIPWNPKDEPDPSYHYEKIKEGLDLAASKLPRVDAIGGSSAGVYVDNKPMVASLFRSVDVDLFEEKVKPMFINIGKERGVPLTVINDGDVTALAGAMSLKKDGMLGMAMGSSEAVGFLNRKGSITGWLNELAFAPVDFNREAAVDEWSGDYGVGSMYFSQQAVNKLAPAAGMSFPEDMDLPHRLKAVQEKADSGDEQAALIFETIGVYLGCTIPWYAEFYDFEDLLILGRVTSGRGGEIIIETARKVLAEVFPGIDAKINIHVPDEKSRRVGQAVAAASLPEIG